MRPLKTCLVCKKSGYSFCVHPSINPEPIRSTNETNSKHTPTPIEKPLAPSDSNKPVFTRNANAGGNDRVIRLFLKDYRDHNRKVRRNIRSSLKRRKMPKEHYAELARSVGLIEKSNWESAANITGRLRLQKYVVQEFEKHVLFNKGGKRLDYDFITFCSDRFATLELEPVADLFALKEMVRLAMRKEPEYNYIAFVDVTSITNFPRNGLGECILFEVHMIAWRLAEPTEKARKVFSKGLPSGFNTIISKNAVLVSPRRKRPTPARALAYVSKSPYWGKRIVTSKNSRTGEPFLKMKDVPLPKTMRLLSISRILSNHTVNELIISKGVGALIVANAIARLRQNNPQQPKRTPKARRKMRARSEQSWSAAQSGRVKRKYVAPRIRMSRIDPTLPSKASKEVEPWLESSVSTKLAERSPKKL